MKKTLLLSLLSLLTFVACEHHDDFDFTGTVVDYEVCNSIYDVGYAVALTSPDSIGGSYTTSDQKVFENVVVIYGSDRMLHGDDHISGRIYLDPNYSKTGCNYRYTDNDVPEAVFTKLKVD